MQWILPVQKSLTVVERKVCNTFGFQEKPDFYVSFYFWVSGSFTSDWIQQWIHHRHELYETFIAYNIIALSETFLKRKINSSELFQHEYSVSRSNSKFIVLEY